MVTGMVKAAMGFQRSPSTPRSSTPKSSTSSPSFRKSSATAAAAPAKTIFSRSFGVYVPRSTQVQPRPPDVADLLRLVEELREKESRLKIELLEYKLLKETAAIVPFLEQEISSKNAVIEMQKQRIESLEAENEMLMREVEKLRREGMEREEKMKEMEKSILELRRALSERKGEVSKRFYREMVEADDGSSSQRFDGSGRWNLGRSMRKGTKSIDIGENKENQKVEIAESKEKEAGAEPLQESRCNGEIREFSFSYVKSRAPRVPKPPPKPSSSSSSSSSLSSSSSSSSSSSASGMPPNPPPIPPPAPGKKAGGPMPPPPPPPPPPARASKATVAKVKRVPEVVELYHSLMRRDSKRESSASVSDALVVVNTRDMIGEIENRSAHLLAIKTDVEKQGDFIRFLIKEVQDAAFTNIEDVVAFVKWLDEELSFLVDERAVLKHFDWPESKADALREAAFGYSDLKKLESEVSSFHDDIRQPCGPALKKMQALLEKLEHGVYNLSRMREAMTKRYKGFQMPWEWMLETGFVSQTKLASVKLAMKYLKRVSAELEAVGGPEEEELMLQGVRFAFRVHQFAGGFDMETMRAFQELKNKARSFHMQ